MEDFARLEVLELEDNLESLEPLDEAVVVRVKDGGKEEGLYMFPAPPRPAGV